MMHFRDSEEMSLALKHTNVSAMQVGRGEFLATWMHHSLLDWSRCEGLVALHVNMRRVAAGGPSGAYL
jgi:hypothetical protein